MDQGANCGPPDRRAPAPSGGEDRLSPRGGSQRQPGWSKKDSQAPLRHIKGITTVASFRTWRGSRAFIAQDPAIKKNMAEKEGFEPSVRCRTHAFQACSFSHSDTSPRQ